MVAPTPSSKLRALLGKSALVFLLATLLAALPGCGVRTGDTPSPAPPLARQMEPVPTPQPRNEPSPTKISAIFLISLSGEVRAKEQVTISPKVQGRVAELKAGVGDWVKKKDLLVVLEHEAMDVQVKQAEATLASAEAALQEAEAKRDLLLAGATREQMAVNEAAIRVAEANLELLLAGATKEQIAAAEATVAAAQARLDLLMAGPKPEQLKIAEAEVEIAEQDVIITEYKSTISTPSNPAFQEAQAALRLEEIRLARREVDIARYELELLKALPKPEEVAQLKGAVDAAKIQLEALKAPPRSQQVAQLKAALDVSKAQLGVVTAPPRPQQVLQEEAAVARAKAQVALAQAALQLAKKQQEEAFLYSPVDGQVASRSLSVGSLASAGTPILTILSTEVEAVISVNEAALGQISPGQPLSLTSPAYPSQSFYGRVRTIAPSANSVTRSFEVFIDIQDAKSRLYPGMSVRVSTP